jgi:ribosomal protein L32
MSRMSSMTAFLFPCDAEANFPIVTEGAELSLDHNGDRPSRRSLARFDTRNSHHALSIVPSPRSPDFGSRHASHRPAPSIDYSPAKTLMVRFM